MQNINRDFMGFFGPGLMAVRIKEAAPALADRIEKLIKAAQAGLREQTQEQINEMIAQEVQRYAQELSEDEVKVLQDQVRDILRERQRLIDQPAIQGFKSARVVRDDAAALVSYSRARGFAAARKSARLAYPPRGAWKRRTKDVPLP